MYIICEILINIFVNIFKFKIGVFPSNYVTEISDTKSVSRSDSKTSTGSFKMEESIKKGILSF